MDFFRRLFKGREEGEPQTPAEEKASVTPPAPAEPNVDTASLVAPLQTRPLPPPKPFTSSHRRITFGQASDVGQVRNNNQDACLSLLGNPELTGSPPPIGFFVIADGMGGHHDGELASTITVQTLARHVIEEVITPHLDGSERSADQKTIPEVLHEAMASANEAVMGRVPSGGTTATCGIIRGDLAYIAHVGDSRAYLISEGNMELITRDHSLVARLKELGQITAEEAEVHPQRNVLYRAIGQSDAIEPDAATRRLPPSSRLLLCSDGLWGVVGDEKMAEILSQYADPQEVCEHLVETANSMGGPDNVTVILVQMPD
jgi:protein phosphatase